MLMAGQESEFAERNPPQAFRFIRKRGIFRFFSLSPVLVSALLLPLDCHFLTEVSQSH